ncbi:MAG: hypothetical protein MI749_19270 [Desulfovibrionales bacterium]|nr:hypothetical protein [Desulfovibrionales bacterium]
MKTRTMTQVCTCENCGNEAEMILSCTWVDLNQTIGKQRKSKQRHKDHPTKDCTLCGNEAHR